jgi:hypothetical protein
MLQNEKTAAVPGGPKPFVRVGRSAEKVAEWGNVTWCDLRRTVPEISWLSLSSHFPKSCKINRLQTKKDSILIAVRRGPVISPRRPEPPAALQRLYRTRAEYLVQLHAFVKTSLRYSANVTQALAAVGRGTLFTEVPIQIL